MQGTIAQDVLRCYMKKTQQLENVTLAFFQKYLTNHCLLSLED